MRSLSSEISSGKNKRPEAGVASCDPGSGVWESGESYLITFTIVDVPGLCLQPAQPYPVLWPKRHGAPRRKF